jgi:hypothetical protein
MLSCINDKNNIKIIYFGVTMKTLLKLTALSIALSSAASYASDYQELNQEANDALYHLSKYCGIQLGDIKRLYPNSWIGRSAKWANANNNYGYTFDVFFAPNYFNTESLATLNLSATYIANPPADGSSYRYRCTIQWEN